MMQRRRSPAITGTEPSNGRARNASVGALLVVGVMIGAALAVLAVGALLTTSSPGPSAEPQIAVTAGITLDPKKGAADSSVMVTGNGFPVSSTVDLVFVSPSLLAFNLDGQIKGYNTPVTASTSGSGSFSAYIDAGPVNKGLYEVVATDGSASASKTFKVVSSPYTLHLVTSSVAAGGCVQLKGTGFYPGDLEFPYVSWTNTAGFKGLHTFYAGSMTGVGNFSHKICTTYVHNGVTLDWPVGTYGIDVVGETYGSGSVTLTVT
jgi:hypothetical protein